MSAPTGTRRCSQCRATKPLTAFPKAGGRAKYGLNYWCRACISVKNRQYRAANTERIRLSQAAYRASNREVLADRRLEKYRNRDREVHSSRARRSALKTRYGITVEQYQYLVEQQHGVCAICGNPPSGQNKRLVVDHDHSCCPTRETCGRCLRGLLCSPCNLKLGWLEKHWPQIARHATGKLAFQ